MQDIIHKPETAHIIETRAPARLDRLPWGRFHTLVIAALGITWVLDGLEVTLAGSVAGALKASPVLQFTDSDVGLASSLYLAGAVSGALYFGWMADRLGRRLLFFITLTLYLVAAAATAFSWDLASFCLFRFLTGAGIGGEYSAVNSTIQEMIPARFRGWTDLALGGTFWIGGALSAGALDPASQPGAAQSRAWLAARLFHRRRAEPHHSLSCARGFPKARAGSSSTAARPRRRQSRAKSRPASGRMGRSLRTLRGSSPCAFVPRTHTPLAEVFRTIFVTYRTRALVGLTLMASQAFFYNAIFFTYALVLTKFYGVPAQAVGWYILPFALANVLGPIFLGHLFDTVGRKPMIAATYAISGVLLALSGWLFAIGALSATQQTIAWAAIFFFASPAAGSAYLTVSEVFPVEIRALAIAIFYSLGTAIGGAGAPYLLGSLIETGSRMSVFAGYLLGAGLMIFAAIVELAWGVAAERKPLESVAQPLSHADD